MPVGSSPFDAAFGIEQGRIAPINAAVPAGTQVFVLGTDRLPAPIFDFDVGDSVTVQQSVDPSADGVRLYGSSWRVRQPADVPRRVDLPAGTTLQHGGLVATSTLHARLAVGAGAGQVVYWAVAVGTAGAAVRVEHRNDGPGQTLLVSFAAPDVVVRLATDGAGVATSTAAAVAQAVRLHVAAAAQVTAVAGGDGSGIAATAAIANLVLTAEDLDAVVTLAAFFTDVHVGRTLRVSGSVGGNDGDRRVVGLLSASQAILATAVTTEGAGFTSRLVGARWEAAVLVDGAVRRAVIPAPGEDLTLTDQRAHVSKVAAGAHTLAYRLRLVEVD